MKDLEILKNAPVGATHVNPDNQYFWFDGDDRFVYSKESDEWLMTFYHENELDEVRSLSDIKRIVELQAEIEMLKGVKPELPPFPPEGKGLPRYGISWNGEYMPITKPMDEGYWTPFHLAEAEITGLKNQLQNQQMRIYEHNAALVGVPVERKKEQDDDLVTRQ